MSWRRHEAVDETRAWLNMAVEAWARGGPHLAWLLELSEVAGPFGAVGLTLEAHRVSVGYGLARDHWGQGLMTEAVEALVAVASSLPGVHRVWAYCDIENTASARVMEKVGMEYEATLQRWAMHPNLSDVPRDVLVYVLPPAARRA